METDNLLTLKRTSTQYLNSKVEVTPLLAQWWFTSEKMIQSTWGYSWSMVEVSFPPRFFSFTNRFVKTANCSFHLFLNMEGHKSWNDIAGTTKIKHKWEMNTNFVRLFSLNCWNLFFVLVCFYPQIWSSIDDCFPLLPIIIHEETKRWSYPAGTPKLLHEWNFDTYNMGLVSINR